MVTKRTARARIAKLENLKPAEPYEIQIVGYTFGKRGRPAVIPRGIRSYMNRAKPPKIV
jgi:hypothetical protein